MTVMYFAWVRERVGLSREEIELPVGVRSVSELIGWLRTRGDGYERAFAHPDVIRTAVNQTHVKPDASLIGAHEVAFFPPVTGG